MKPNQKTLRNINQDEFRLYMACKKRFYFSDGKEKIKTLQLRIVERAFEMQAIQSLPGYPADPITDTELIFKAAQSLERDRSLTLSEYQKVTYESGILWDQLNRTIRLSNYIPIYGPLDFTKTLKRNTLTLHISCIGCTQNGSLRAWVFTPYKDERDICWDPLHMIQFDYAKNLYDTVCNKKTDRFILYIISLNQSKKEFKISSMETCNKNTRKAFIKHIYSVDRELYDSIDSPLLPCYNNNCPYRKVCLPERDEK